jgi:CRP-like cAMP-binding protein
MPQTRPSHENKILTSLRRPEFEDPFPGLERVDLSLGEIIYEPESEIEYIYFPEGAVFSMLAMMEDGDTVEVGPVGGEGLVGLNLFFGANTSPTQVIVHVAGTAKRLKAGGFRQELDKEKSPLARLLLRYTQMLLAMTGQSSACNKLHSIEQQFARWLLQMHDYAGDELLLTHDLIAQTLGVRRAGITTSAVEFKGAGLIGYTRGHVRLLDRAGLEAKACECYGVIKEEYDRLYADLPALMR